MPNINKYLFLTINFDTRFARRLATLSSLIIVYTYLSVDGGSKKPYVQFYYIDTGS